MKVVLTGDISGSRNGQPWPAAGSEMDLPDDEAYTLVQSGMARAVDSRNADIEKRAVEAAQAGVDEGTKAAVAHATTTRERQARSKRAHEPLNMGVADPEQPVEDDNGPRRPEVNASESAKVEDPAQDTSSDDGPTGETAEPSEGKSSSRKSSKK